MTNQQLIRHLETDTLPEDSFHHAEHVRLAFAYLSEYPPLEALDKFASALKRYAAARGKSDRYHETITHAYFFLIRERMVRAATADWDEFARENSDLLEWKNGILTHYYWEETLKSDLARTVFVFPDKCPPHR
jgi:alkanesulfonate monooxygenase SsuD/methylene tetrahydromethanopterin reductase-like flavin-dependent oxidoreductase (luciferase family)